MAQVPKRILKKARIEIIPLIDVIFFLLATFVLFTLSLNRLQSVDLDLPESVIRPPIGEEEPTVIQVSDQGTLYWNREIIEKSELVTRLENLKRQEADPKVLVAGDQYAIFGPTLEVLDLARRVGIEKVSMETRIRPTGM